MKLTSYCLIAALVFAGSCSKKSDPVPPCLLTKRTATYSIGGVLAYTTTDTYEYDPSYYLTTWTQVVTQSNTSITYTYKYSFNSGRVIGVSYTFTGSNSAVNSTWTNENGHVTKIDVPSYLSTSLYGYDSQGKLTSWNFTSTSPNFKNQNNTYTYDATGNLLSSKVEFVNTSTTTTYSSFDAKNNPYALLARAMGQPNLFARLEGFVSDEFLSKNNPLLGSITGGANPAYTYTYEYNAKGYPTRSVRTEPIPATLTTVFEYQNCE